jgi:hypothetical protein
MPDRSEPQIAEPKEPPPPIVPAATASTLFVGSAAAGPMDPKSIRSLAAFEALYGGSNPSDPLAVSIGLFFENGGTDARVLRIASQDAAGAPAPLDPAFTAALRAGGAAYHALQQADDFALLCVPGLTDVAAIGDLLDLCGARDALLLLDAPEAWLTACGLPAEVADRVSASSGVLYAPRVLVPGAGPSPASGAVAGVYARSDAMRGVWRSPAGLDLPLRGMTGLSVNLDQHAADRLLGLAINPLLDFPRPPGPVIWGARTIASAQDTTDELRFVAVRRLVLFIERSVGAGVKWAEFEPNDEILWARLVAAVGEFLLGLHRAGALAGSAPGQSFFVRCDRTTMTQADIDAGNIQIEIGVAPLKPAEFVVIKIGMWSA